MGTATTKGQISNEGGAMSVPQGQSSGLTLEDSALNESPPTGAYADSLPDTLKCFEAWLENLRPSPDPTQNQLVHSTVANGPSRGEISFDGTLRVDGYAAGFFRSLTGTLIIGETGEVEADISVATAIIDGCVNGNIRATERVVLDSHAKVFGNVESPALSIQPGAIFEGQSHPIPSPYQADGEDRGRTRSCASTFSMPSSADSRIANEADDEEEAKLLAFAGGR
jgi:cytoskeletal protein CcmA (bactofilin family)